MLDHVVLFHDSGDGLPDGGEGGALVEEGFHGDFVGGIEHGGQCAADFTGMAGEIEGWEVLGAWCFKMQCGELGEVERAQVVRHAIRPGHGILDRETHVAVTELGDDAVVGKLDHAVDDALRVNDDFDAAHGDVEEPARFDHLQAFVEERG